MNTDYMLIALAWVIIIALLILFIPKHKIREALVAFLFTQVMTWILGLSVVQLRLIEYPVRLFPDANKASFTFEFFIYPAICAIFIVHYPEKKNVFGKFMYFFYYCTLITGTEVIVEKYTNILTYIHWTWYITWITLFVTFYMSRIFNIWFFKFKEKN